MLTFQMGFKNLFVCTALSLVWKVCSGCGQAARVEFINQPYTSSVGTCSVHATPQLVVPAICAPVVSPYDSCIQESVPTVPSYNGFYGYSNYAPSYPQPMPLIIIDDDNDDNWHNILYFLLFAMRNKRNCGSGNFGGCNGGCGCGGNCGGRCCCNCCGSCCCNCGGNCCCNFGDICGCNCGGNCCCNCCGNCCCNCGGNCCCSYIPYPIPYPMCGYGSPGIGGYADNYFGYIEEPYQAGQGPNDINLYIITDQS